MQLALRCSSCGLPSSASIRQKWCRVTGPRKGFARGCRHIGPTPPVSAVFHPQVGKQIAQFMHVSAIHVRATRACLYRGKVTRSACKLCVCMHGCKALLRVFLALQQTWFLVTCASALAARFPTRSIACRQKPLPNLQRWQSHPRGRHLHACSARFLQHTLAVSAPGLVVFRVVICGAGIIGSAIAYYLAVKGVAATVVERASVACASSGIMLKLYTESVPSMTPCTCGLSATAQLASGFC